MKKQVGIEETKQDIGQRTGRNWALSLKFNTICEHKLKLIMDIVFFLLFALLNLVEGLEIYRENSCTQTEYQEHYSKLISTSIQQLLEKDITEQQLKQELMHYRNSTYIGEIFKKNDCSHNKTYFFVIASFISGLLLKLFVWIMVCFQKKKENSKTSSVNYCRLSIFAILMLNHFVFSMIVYINEANTPIGITILVLTLFQFLSGIISDFIQLECIEKC